MTRFRDRHGREVRLGRELGRGGEGSVHEVVGDKTQVAKIYHQPASRDKAEKIWQMAQMGSSEITKFASWPLSTLHRTTSHMTDGVLLPLISEAKEIHRLYSPAQRKTEFPTADWRFLIRVAFNCAAAFDTLHSNGIVVGDVNQGNLLVKPNASVAFIDCDSFQITSNGKTHLCPVGVAHFTPPELDSYSVKRTRNHDYFGLAVIIFHLLFMGRHPFAGRYSGPGDMPLEKAISESRFAYGHNRRRFLMDQPPHSLRLEDVGSTISQCFETAFAPPTAIRQRPSAKEWADSLDKLEKSIQKCATNASHFHLRRKSCPWCRVVSQNGPDFFISVSIARLQSGNHVQIDIDRLEADIESSTFYETSLSYRKPAEITPRVPTLDVVWLVAFICCSVAAAFSLWGVVAGFWQKWLCCISPPTLIMAVYGMIYTYRYPKNRLRLERTRWLQQTEAVLRVEQNNFDSSQRKARNAFDRNKKELLDQVQEYRMLDQTRVEEFARLRGSSHRAALEDFLERHLIEYASINGIGPSRVAALESFGIETAADVDYHKIENIPGFGPALANVMIAWRKSIEHRFQYNPGMGLPRSEVLRVELKLAQKRIYLQKRIELGPTDLRKLNNQWRLRTSHFQQQFDLHIAQYEQAKSEWLALSGQR